MLEVLRHGTQYAISFLVGALAHQLEILVIFRIFGHPSKTASFHRFLSSARSTIVTVDVALC
jgi:hypothetical protein